MISQVYTRWLYYIGLLGIIAGMSLSKPAVSMGIIICSIAWLSEADFKNRLAGLKNQPYFWIAFALIFLHLLGLLWSENIAYGLKDIKTKLPLLVLPFIFYTSKTFDIKKEWFWIRVFFNGSLLVCTLLSFGIYYGWIKPGQFDPVDMRTMVFGVSGVRLALFLCLAICILAYDAYMDPSWFMKAANVFFIAWFLFFLNFVESGTGIVFLLALAAFTFVYFVIKILRPVVRNVVLGASALFVVCAGIYIYNQVSGMFVLKPSPVAGPVSKGGEPYGFDDRFPYVENGYVVGKYIAPDELKDAWNKRSLIKMDGLDKQNQPIFATIIRYLNSKTGIKDREAVEQLTEQDIRNIENGIANYNYTTMYGWQRRLTQIVFELVAYQRNLNPFGNSVTQRFEYWKIGYGLFKANPLTGIGTGDVKDAYENAYKKYSFSIDPRFRLRTHNQYLTMAVTFGVLGVVVFLVFAFSQVFTKGYKDQPYLALAFMLIMLLSFLSEDTLENQSGVTFIAFFQAYFNYKYSV